MGRRVAAVMAVAIAFLAIPASPAYARHRCAAPVAAAAVVADTPYEDELYAPRRLAPFATGKGIRVAVIDSGVDPNHPQLRGRVEAGRDVLYRDPDARQDCRGHGTAVASVIAAAPSADTGFVGLAPDATIVPVRISEQIDANGKLTGRPGSYPEFADAIDWAVRDGVQVINMSLATTVDHPDVRAAVRRAVHAGVVVVASVGNDAEHGNPDPYPAAYDGVIGVGAVTRAGVRAPYSQHGRYVDLVAVGDDVTVAGRGGGQLTDDGTSFAAPFVAATAALIRERYPHATPAEVERRLEATADPSPAGTRSDDYGFGLLNPYRAVTETVGPVSVAARVPDRVRAADPAAVAAAADRARSRHLALLVGAVGAAAVLVVAVAAAVVRRGRRRGWRPADR